MRVARNAGVIQPPVAARLSGAVAWLSGGCCMAAPRRRGARQHPHIPSKTGNNAKPHIERVSATVWGNRMDRCGWRRRRRIIDLSEAVVLRSWIETPHHRRSDDVGLGINSRLRREEDASCGRAARTLVGKILTKIFFLYLCLLFNY